MIKCRWTLFSCSEKHLFVCKTLGNGSRERHTSVITYSHLPNACPLNNIKVIKMSNKQEKQTKPIVSVISGGVAGGVEALVTYPFEFAKTRAQLHVRKAGVPYPRNPFAVVGQVYSQEGLRALYKGVQHWRLGRLVKMQSDSCLSIQSRMPSRTPKLELCHH